MNIAEQAEISVMLDGLKQTVAQLEKGDLSPTIAKMIREDAEKEIELLRAKVLPKARPVSGCVVIPFLRVTR
jgi:hypothetical protein